MRKTTLTIAMLALASATTSNAATFGADLQNSAPPTKASYTITLSGECSGKITQNVQDVGISYEYDVDDVTKAFIRHSTRQYVYIGSTTAFDDEGDPGIFFTEAGGNNYVTPDKFTEKVAKGKRIVSFNLTSAVYPSLRPISDEPEFAAAVKCKDGKTLAQVLDGWYLYFNKSDPSFKTKTSVKLESALSNPTVFDYTVTQSISGIVEQKSICTGKGAVGSEEYSVSCAQPPAIKFKVQLKAQGTAAQVI